MSMGRHDEPRRSGRGLADGKARVSVLVPVKNEAENLRRCLPALAWADEVFVVDSRSTDETARVAAEHGARVVQFQFNGTYPKKKNWALEHLPFRNDWVLIVDADEVVVPALAEEIALRTAADEADGFYLNMKYYFLGRRIRHCGYAEAWNLRLFKHELGRYEAMPVAPGAETGDNEAHEHVELRGRALRLRNELDHYAYPTISAWVEKHNRYASWEAEMYERFLREPVPATIGPGKRFKRRLKKVYIRLPLRPLVRFVYAYILRLGFLDGRPGLIFCTLLSFYDFLAAAKVYERRIVAGPEGLARREEPGSELKCRPMDGPRVRASGVGLGGQGVPVQGGQLPGLALGREGRSDVRPAATA
jgi:glycosyltransferase involved in cell wall biosynthesis